jgi:hypothetical protein
VKNEAVSDAADELRVKLELVLRRLRLCSAVGGRAFVGTVHSGRPGSSRPPPVDDPAGRYALEAERAGDDASQLRAILRHADADLTELLRRPLVEIKSETREELETRIVDVGSGFEAIEVAVALHTSEAIVRRARLKAGRDAERGRRLPDDVVNGQPLRFGLALLEAGYPLRVAAELSGVAKSTLHDHLQRGG